ncbi:MAG: FG-GAP-like repeat-containing protein [Candidatus Eisenbacteria bacterium]
MPKPSALLSPRLLLASLGAALLAFGTPPHAGRDASPTRLAALASPDARWEARVRADLDRREYEVVAQGGAWVAPNRARGLAARFTAAGVEIRARAARPAAAPCWSWRTIALGRPQRMRALAAAAPSASGHRVRYAHPGMTEWYDNRAEGLEQGFTVLRRPGGAGALRIEGHVTTAGTTAAHRGARMAWHAPGQAEFVAEQLRAWDAEGRELDCRFEPEGDRLALVVDDAGAVYPVTLDPLLGFANHTYIGDQYSGRFGYSVRTAGDVNGDGYSDLLVSAALYDVGALGAAGKVWLYLGSATGVSASAAWTVEGDEAAQWCGYDVAPAGDVNGDGYADFIVGFSRATYQGTLRAGMVKVYFGSAAGVDPVVETIPGGVANQELGRRVSYLGDVDGDGYDDVLVGRMDSFYVYRGGPDGVDGVAVLAKALPYPANDLGISFSGGDVNGDGYADIAAVSSSVGDSVYVFLGGSVLSPTPSWRLGLTGGVVQEVEVIGDVDGAGNADILVGEPHAAPAGLADAGRVRVFPGGSSAPSGTSFTLNGTQAGALLGESLCAAGDLDGDGLADFAAAERSYLLPSGFHGRVHVIHGRSAGLSGALHEILDGPAHAVSFGSDVGSAGDVNGDGFGDLVVGDDRYTDAVALTGAAWVYHGGPTRLFDPAAFDREGNVANASFGAAIAGGFDVDHDGYCDAIVGAPYYDDGALAAAGRVFLYRGGTSGLSNFAAWTLSGTQAGAHFGASVAGAGDVDDDGFDDFLVGEPERDVAALAGAGRAWLFRGGTTLSNTPWWTRDGSQANASLGASLCGPGDVNGDGFDDVVIGVPHWSNGQSFEGRIECFLGGANGPGGSPQFGAESNQVNAMLGLCVAAVGDVNRDRFADVAAGAPLGTSTVNFEGTVTVYRGGATGLSAAASQVLAGGQASMNFGRSIAGGDVNGDGCSDVLVGAPFYDASFTSQGVVRLFPGGAGGVATAAAYSYLPAWSGAYTGWSVASLGDVNLDGFGDFAVGAPGYDGPAGVDAGRVAVVYGTAALPSSSGGFVADGGTAGAGLGSAVAGAGDTNGDGAPDLLAGSPDFANGAAGEGRAQAWFALESDGAPRPFTLERVDGSRLSLGGLVHSGAGFRVQAFRRCAAGRARVRLQCQYAPLGTSFAFASVRSNAWSAMQQRGSDAEAITVSSALATNTGYRVRVRLQSRHPYFPATPWTTPNGASPSLAHLRTRPDNLDVDTGPAAGGLALASPAPNPSRGPVALAFTLPSATPVRVEIFDAAGRRVRSLAEGPRAAGRHVLKWDGRDAQGRRAAPGLYLVRMTSRSGGATRTLVRLEP